MKLLSSIIVSLLVAGATSRPHVGDLKNLTTDNVENDISREHIEKTLQKLQEISDKNGGSRAFGTPGDYQSFQHILNQLHTYENYGPGGQVLNVTTQSFKRSSEDFRGIKLTGPEGENVEVTSPMHNAATASRDGITAPLVHIPEISVDDSECNMFQYDNINVTNKIVLLKESRCQLDHSLVEASVYGATGAILCKAHSELDASYNYVPVEQLTRFIPAGIIDCEVAESWTRRLLKGEELNVTLMVDTRYEQKETWNIIAETSEGDPDNVVMLGTHLDSGRGRPGIIDSGSASAALLEIARSIVQYKGYKNKIRFAWWEAHEHGLAGASYYASHLTPEEVEKIRFYNELSMVDSLGQNDKLPDGKKSVEKLLGPPKPSSDREIFSWLGIPLVGLLEGTSTLQGQPGAISNDNYTGDGEPEAALSCVHPTCDHIDYIDWKAMMAHIKATGRRIAQLALSLKRAPPRKIPECESIWCHTLLHGYEESAAIYD